MSFLNFLSGALTTGTQAAGAYEQGKLDKQKRETQDLLQQIKLARESQDDALRQQMGVAQMKHLNKQSELYEAQAQKALAGDDDKYDIRQDENGNWVRINKTKSTYSPITAEEAQNAGQAAPVPEQPASPLNTAPTLQPTTRPTLKGKVAPLMRTFNNQVQISEDQGKTWRVLGAAPQPFGAGTVMAGEDGGTPKLVVTSGPRMGATIDVPGVKAGSGAGNSAQGAVQSARLGVGRAEMNNAHNGMSEYEEGLKTGAKKITATGQLLQRVANAFTHDDPLSQILQSGALVALNNADPDLARYIRRGISFAEGESMISSRPSDYRTKLASFLSTAASGASPELVSDIQGRRTAILNGINAIDIPGSQPTHTPSQPTAQPKQAKSPSAASKPSGKVMSKAAYDAAIKAGHTDAEIKAAGWTVRP